MNDTILVADDSQTIQKVISITLSSESYQIDKALNEDELFKNLESGSHQLVVVDFGLSEDKNGFELIEKIKSINSQIRVLTMLGTFDNVDKDKLRESGSDDFIVKPFESSDFVNKCSSLMVGVTNQVSEAGPGPKEDDPFESKGESKGESASINEDNKIVESSENENKLDDINTLDGGFETPSDASLLQSDEWSISSPAEATSFEQEQTQEAKTDEDFQSELSDWVAPLPQKIGRDLDDTLGLRSDEEVDILPPIIGGPGAGGEETGSFEIPREIKETIENSENAVPSTEDLEYPDPNAAPQFDSIDYLAPEDGEGEITDPEIDTSKLDFDSIEDLDLSKDAQDFWAVDESIEEIGNVENDLDLSSNHSSSLSGAFEESSDYSVDEESALDDLEKPYELDETFPAKDSFESGEQVVTQLDEEKIVASLMEKLLPVIEKQIQSYLESSVDKVAWEIIPDLAENIIKKEISEISASID
ncbi:response regulator [bacterium]|nr:response regulator [bacterium]